MPRSLRALLLLFVFAAPAVAADKPNVVFILGDDQGWTDYGFMGHEHVRTPHLDKLAAQSLVFKRGYVPTSLCRASLATMVTGLYPHQHKITSNDPPIPAGVKPAQANANATFLADRAAMVKLFEQSPALPKLLADRGYVSHQSGKWWEGNACRCGGFTAGMTVGDPDKKGRHGDAGLTIGREGLRPVFDFIDAAATDGKPFYVWYAPMMPHQPHTPPERLLKAYQDKTPSAFVAKYWAMCEWFDETVGDLLAHLESKKLTDNTIVIYLHDNGWIQDPAKDTFAAKSKRSPYDGGTRTPILVRWPAKVKPGESNALASSIDLVPTVLAAAGGTPSADMPGVNLLDAATVAKRSAVFGEIFEHNAVDIARPAANLMYRWVIDGHTKLIVPNPARVPDGKPELYDLKADPTEEKNLAADKPARVAELSKTLDAWWPAGGPQPKKPAGPEPTHADVPYGKHERQMLDFYQATSDSPTPVVFAIHGGGWVNGDKSSYRAAVARYLKAGVSVVAINYRYVTQAAEAKVEPPVTWPVADAARALQFVRSKAKEWNLDKARIGATGGSAGGCSSLWLLYHDDLADPKSDDPIARESTRLFCAAVTGAQTTLDPKPLKEWMPNARYGGHAFGVRTPQNRDGAFAAFFERREKLLPWIAEYSPLTHVTTGDPPVFLEYPAQKKKPVKGEDQDDPTHSALLGMILLEKVKAEKCEAILVYPGQPHDKYKTSADYLIDRLTATK